MPELPEVETVVRDLKRLVLGAKVKRVWLDVPKFKVVESLVGRKILKVERRAKYIIFHLDKNKGFMLHLKMTGHLLLGEWTWPKKVGEKPVGISPFAATEPINRFIHFLLELDDKRMVGFSDMRKFGRVEFGELDEILNHAALKKMATDLIFMDFADFKERVLKRKRNIYQTLLDQSVVAGLGNIYVNDTLYKAKVHPKKVANQLSVSELKRLYEYGREILNKAIELRGTSVDDFRDLEGEKGNYGAVRLIYGRKGEKCKKCETIIEKMKIGGRSICYCKNCQKL